MPNQDQQELMQLAESILSVEWNTPITLTDPQKLPSQHTVFRVTVQNSPANQPNSVILKQITTTQFNTSGAAEGESQRFLNEWATLEFLTALEGDFGPRLLGSDAEHNLIILQDFGNHPSIKDVLIAEDQTQAETALIGMGRFLGQMQATAYGKQTEFRKSQATRHTASPTSDSNLNFSDKTEGFRDYARALDIELSPAFYQAVVDLENELHDPTNPFYSFTHCDAGPHNFLFMADGEIQLLDFEFGDFENGLLDLVSARLGFPHMNPNNHVPFELVAKMEAAYQTELAKVAPEVADEAYFQRAITNACAHWVVSRWLAFWGQYLKMSVEVGADVAPAKAAEKFGISEEILWMWFSGVLLLFTNFVATAEQSGHQPEIKAGVEQLIAYLNTQYPNLKPADVFPAFR